MNKMEFSNCYPLLITHYQLLITDYSLPITHEYSSEK